MGKNEMDYEITLPIHDDLGGYKSILYLESSDARACRESLESMATYFKREFRFDHLQYASAEHHEDFTGVLFLEPDRDLAQNIDDRPNRVIGGAGFLKNPNGYVLDWVWFHPFARNRGNLRKHWPELKIKFGKFAVTTPISAQMQRCLEKNA
jgi:hypothetical protein